MVRIGVVSDSHKNMDLLRSAACALRDAHAVNTVVHLGDYQRDAIELRRDGLTVWTVPGTMCPGYGGPEHILRETVEGMPLVCAHTPEDLRGAVTSATRLAMHGHTHVPFMEQRGNTVWLNPGHLKSPLDRGQRPSYAVVELEPGLITATIYDLDGPIRASGAFKLPLESDHA